MNYTELEKNGVTDKTEKQTAMRRFLIGESDERKYNALKDRLCEVYPETGGKPYLAMLRKIMTPQEFSHILSFIANDEMNVEEILAAHPDCIVVKFMQPIFGIAGLVAVKTAKNSTRVDLGKPYQQKSIKTNHIEILTEIKNSLIGMEKTGTLDHAILVDIQKLNHLINAIQSEWLKCSDSDGFYFWSAIDNVEGVVGKILDRLFDPEKSCDTSKTAADSLAVLPAIRDIFEVMQPDKIDRAAIDDVLHKTSDLRNVASDNNLFPRITSELDPQFIAYARKNNLFENLFRNITDGDMATGHTAEGRENPDTATPSRAKSMEVD